MARLGDCVTFMRRDLAIQRWQQNWLKNGPQIRLEYGERWFRLWHLFLAWSAHIGRQGNWECFQVLAHKNLDSFDRRIFLGACGSEGVEGESP